MNIPKKIKSEIEKFCKLNKIKDVDKFIIKTLQTGFNVGKYGNAPWKLEVEKEVPVEVIKEVVIEKEVFVTDDEKVNKLVEKLNELNDKISETDKTIEEKNKIIKTLGEKLTKSKKQIKNLENNNTKDAPPDNLYDDDGKGGWWGSNLLNRK